MHKQARQSKPGRLERRTLAEQVADLLAADVRQRQAGDRLPSISELAKHYAVSAITIGEALAGLGREGLIVRRHGSGTYVADPRSQQHVGLLIETDIAHPSTVYYFRQQAQEAVRLLRARGYRARLYAGHLQPTDGYPTATTCPEFLEAVRTGQLCGVVTVSTEPLAQWRDPLAAAGVPIVGDGPLYPYGVGLDYAGMVAEGARYLLANGRRKLALLEWHSRDTATPTTDVCRQAFCSTLAAAGVTGCDAWVRSDLPPAQPGSGWEGLREVWSARAEKPDGLLVCDDNLMRGAAMGMLSLGIRVPEQLLVVSHANTGSGLAYPFPLVELAFDPNATARAKVDMIEQLMRREALVESQVILPYELLDGHPAALPAGGTRTSQTATL